MSCCAHAAQSHSLSANHCDYYNIIVGITANAVIIYWYDSTANAVIIIIIIWCPSRVIFIVWSAV